MSDKVDPISAEHPQLDVSPQMQDLSGYKTPYKVFSCKGCLPLQPMYIEPEYEFAPLRTDLRWDWTLISKCWFNPLECTRGPVIFHIYRTLPYCVTERDLIPYTHYFLIRSPVQIWLNLVNFQNHCRVKKCHRIDI